MLFVSNPLIVIYLISGVAVGSVIEGWVHKKTPPPPAMQYGILAVGALLVFWNAYMYVKAAKPVLPGEKFPPTALERYQNPVTASACFLVGFLMLFVM